MTEGEICVGESGAEFFPKKLARNYLSMGPSCGSGDFERTGNAIAGKFSCGVDPQRATGEIKATYAGIVSEERFDLDAEIKFDVTFNDPEAQREMESSQMTRGVGVKLTAQRKGDCQAS